MKIKNVTDARTRFRVLKGMNTKQVKDFIESFNVAIDAGEDEGIAVGMALESDITKSTVNDINRMLNAALSEITKENEYGYIYDYDMEYVYVRIGEYGEKDNGKLVKFKYTIMNSVATIDKMSAQEVVVGDVNYIEVIDIEDDKIVIKSFCDDQMIEVAPMYIAPLELDGHEETATAEELRKMVDNFTKFIHKHIFNFDHDNNKLITGVKPLKAWINECECYIGDQFVPEGQPIIKVQYTDVELWKKRKSDQYAGWSIQANGNRVKRLVEVEEL